MVGEMQMVMGQRGAWKALRQVRPVAVYAFVPNKPNFSRFWSENKGRHEKQSQSKPISRSRGLWAIPGVVSRPSGSGVQGAPWRSAPNKANFCVLGLETAMWAKKQSQSAQLGLEQRKQRPAGRIQAELHALRQKW